MHIDQRSKSPDNGWTKSVFLYNRFQFRDKVKHLSVAIEFTRLYLTTQRSYHMFTEVIYDSPSYDNISRQRG